MIWRQETGLRTLCEGKGTLASCGSIDEEMLLNQRHRQNTWIASTGSESSWQFVVTGVATTTQSKMVMTAKLRIKDAMPAADLFRYVYAMHDASFGGERLSGMSSPACALTLEGREANCWDVSNVWRCLKLIEKLWHITWRKHSQCWALYLQ